MFETERLNARYKKNSSDIYAIFRNLYAMFLITSCYEKDFVRLKFFLESKLKFIYLNIC